MTAHSGKTAIVTRASSGIGRASAEALPRRRYPTGKIARQLSVLRRLVLAEMFDRSLRKQLRLPV